jgi:hypothetical protein
MMKLNYYIMIGQLMTRRVLSKIYLNLIGNLIIICFQLILRLKKGFINLDDV